jgi:hypothetical protein
MSGFVRTIQRTISGRHAKCTAPHFNGRGSRLGVRNPEAKDKLAREAREQRRLAHVHMRARERSNNGGRNA